MEFFDFKKKKSKVEQEDNKDNDDNGDKGKKDDKKKDLPEGNKDGLEEKIGKDIESKEDRDDVAKSIQTRIEFDMAESKKLLKMKKEDKYEMELMRRFSIRIFNIYVTTLKEKMDPFLQFTVGGNFSLKVMSNKAGKTYKVPAGQRGFTDKTEVLDTVDALQKKGFEKVIESEIRMSYSMINSMKLMVEIWDYNTFTSNIIKGYTTENLIDIVNGNMNLGLTIVERNKAGKNPLPYAIIDFKFLFQEIFDFKLNFINWKMSCITPPSQKKDNNNEKEKGVKKPDLQVEILLESKKLFQSNTCIKSEIAVNTDTPNWSDFDNVMIYRGCINDLESQNLILNLYKHSTLFKKKLSTKTVNLKNILNVEKIKTQLTLLDEAENTKYYPSIEGGIIIEPSASSIRYKQTGDNVTLLTTKKYLCIRMMRVENIKPPESMGLVDSFVTAEWCGFTQRTRTSKENNNPNFGEVLYFPAPFPPEYVKTPELYIQKINEELSTKNEVVFNLMIEGDNNTYDNLGIAYFHLSDIKSGEKNNNKYFADDKKKEVTYISRVFTGKAKLTSAFTTSKLTFLHFEAWFLDDFPDLVDFGEKKDKNANLDKIPLELDLYWNHKKKKNDFLSYYKKKIADDFAKQSNYSYKDRLFYNVIKKDQFEIEHFLPYYLSIIGVPDKKFSEEEKEKNRNFFDCNIKTLDEVAHYARNFPFGDGNSGDITVSPDFLLKTRKGSLEDHAILMACLMMGLKKEGPGNFGKKKDAETAPVSDAVKTSGSSAGGEEDVFPYENRVFVCMGKMKGLRTPHIWVMTIDDNYKDITFWDPRIGEKFSLKGRIKEKKKLKLFLERKFKSKNDVDSGEAPIIEQEESIDEDDELLKKKKNNDKFDDRAPNGENAEDLNDYLSEQDSYRDIFVNEYEINANEIDLINNEVNVKMKKKKFNGMIDDRLIGKKNDEGEEKVVFNFVKENNKKLENEMKSGNDTNFLPIEKFKDEFDDDAPPVILPYETIDVIYKKNNVFANYQYFDPIHIMYDIYDDSIWRPLINFNQPAMGSDGKDYKIWTGLFAPFYPLANFGPMISANLINKMREALIKEVRVGVSISRSSSNLQTKFKKKNEQINTILSRYCDYLEDKNLNRISLQKFNDLVGKWKEMIKTKVPKFFKMDAKVMHFNFYDLERIRKNIDEDLKPFYNNKQKNIVFATSAKIYPYLNQIVSVRIILAVFSKIPEYDVPNEELENYQATLKEDPEKMIEEEGSDEDVVSPEDVKKDENAIENKDETKSPGDENKDKDTKTAAPTKK